MDAYVDSHYGLSGCAAAVLIIVFGFIVMSALFGGC